MSSKTPVTYEFKALGRTVARVTNPKGRAYLVCVEPMERCTCPGFAFRQTCKHIGMVRAHLGLPAFVWTPAVDGACGAV